MKRALGLALLLAASACTSGNVLTLSEGDCFDDSASQELQVTDVPIVSCSDPHDNEIYEIVEMIGDTFPGDDAVRTQADDECLAEFEGFVGEPYATSQLDFGWLTPTNDSWSRGDREIVCFVYRVDLAKITGTMENSGF